MTFPDNETKVETYFSKNMKAKTVRNNIMVRKGYSIDNLCYNLHH